MNVLQSFQVKLPPYWVSYLESVNKTYQWFEAASARQAAGILIAIYIRVSTVEQAEEGYSLPEQERECRLFAERHGWQIYQVYTDDGYSGTHGDRPAFQRLLRDGAAGKFQGVVIHKLDRAYRSAQGMLATFSEWQSQGIFLASVSENLDFTTVWGQADPGGPEHVG